MKVAAKLVLAAILISSTLGASVQAVTKQQIGATGVEGTVPGPPPSHAATIDVPKDGQSFSNIPINVSGLCPINTLVEIYKNNVFSGSAECVRGSYSLQIDLFDGR